MGRLIKSETGLLDPKRDWVIAEEADRLREQLSAEKAAEERLALLARLMTDQRMKRVWRELYKKKRDRDKATDEFLYPARVMNTTIAQALRQKAIEFRRKGGDRNIREAELMEAEAVSHERAPATLIDPRLSEQDRGVQLFFYHAYHSAQDIKPVFLRNTLVELDKIRRVEQILREQADVLKSVGMTGNAGKLVAVAGTSPSLFRLPPMEAEDTSASMLTRRRLSASRLHSSLAASPHSRSVR